MVRAPRGESLFGRQPRGVVGDKPGAFRVEVLRGRRGDDRDGRRARAVRLRVHRDGVVRRLRASRQRGPTGALPRDARREDRADLLGRRHRVSHRGLRRARGHRVRGHDPRAVLRHAPRGALRDERGLRGRLRRDAYGDGTLRGRRPLRRRRTTPCWWRSSWRTSPPGSRRRRPSTSASPGTTRPGTCCDEKGEVLRGKCLHRRMPPPENED